MVETKTDVKVKAFRALHRGPPFVMPNPWDAGSARVLAGLGFHALATTSSGFAFSRGRRDGAMSFQEVIDHIRELTRATPLPVSADLENGYGPAPQAAARAVTRAAEAGAVGGSIEDWDAERGIYSLERAVERIEAAAAAARAVSHGFVLTARAENHIRGNPDLGDTITRLQAYEAAGADVLYAPGLRTTAQIRAVCAEVTRPVNVLALRGMSVADVAAAGAQRISVGGGLAWAAVEGLIRAAQEITDRGSFGSLGSAARLGEWLGPGSGGRP
jgi:2-methylisocitrate lyase-like PEP mutase family enzyme